VADGVDRASKKRSDAEAGRKAELERLRRDRERALAEARAAIATLERSVHAARAEAVHAEQSLWRAQSEAKKAKDAYVTLEQKLQHARERMKALPRA
jgi:chromosome segregation ATPase